MTSWQITVRYGGGYHRYHTLEVEAEDVTGALREAADRIPPDVAGAADLVEVRVAVDPDARTYLGEDEGD